MIAKVSQEIAELLGLPEPHKYTSHSFRRSAATELANSGFDATNIQRAAGWSSRGSAERYVNESKRAKVDVAVALSCQNVQQLQNAADQTGNAACSSDGADGAGSKTTITISNNTNCTFNFYNSNATDATTSSRALVVMNAPQSSAILETDSKSM
jgi:hypothetical protein